jgi:hypothetical protein
MVVMFVHAAAPRVHPKKDIWPYRSLLWMDFNSFKKFTSFISKSASQMDFHSGALIFVAKGPGMNLELLSLRPISEFGI